ncbi:hypothetical protein FNF31_02608 [Cafeteria roenbergensis]|uniref:Uncharacterized protein n=1 Tax=Cafeteria roenbergensis TaxID=33653 RepID=A0A5A8DG78_CAFRO|nr:hypothetical protein FNF31_02608 [Cafeteria roenbergensis]
MGTAPPTATRPPKGRARPPTLPASGAERLLGAPRESETTRAAVPRSRRQAVGEYPVWACRPCCCPWLPEAALVTSAAVAALLAILAGAVAHHCHCFEARSVACAGSLVPGTATQVEPLEETLALWLGQAVCPAPANTSWEQAVVAESCDVWGNTPVEAVAGCLAHTWLAYCANAAMPLALLARVGDAARRRAAALETKRAPEADGPSAGSGGGPAAGACEEGDSVRAASARAGPISQAIAAGAFARRVAAAAWESATGRVAAATEAVRGVDLGLERAGTSSRAASVARLHAACAVDLDPLDARALHLLGRAYLEASQAPTSWRVAAWASSAPIPRPSVLDALGALLRAEHAWASLHSGAPWPANLLAQAQAHLAAGDRAAATNCLALCIDLGSAAHADAESAEAAAEAAALRRDEGLV